MDTPPPTTTAKIQDSESSVQVLVPTVERRKAQRSRKGQASKSIVAFPNASKFEGFSTTDPQIVSETATADSTLVSPSGKKVIRKKSISKSKSKSEGRKDPTNASHARKSKASRKKSSVELHATASEKYMADIEQNRALRCSDSVRCLLDNTSALFYESEKLEQKLEAREHKRNAEKLALASAAAVAPKPKKPCAKSSRFGMQLTPELRAARNRMILPSPSSLKEKLAKASQKSVYTGSAKEDSRTKALKAVHEASCPSASSSTQNQIQEPSTSKKLSKLEAVKNKYFPTSAPVIVPPEAQAAPDPAVRSDSSYLQKYSWYKYTTAKFNSATVSMPVLRVPNRFHSFPHSILKTTSAVRPVESDTSTGSDFGVSAAASYNNFRKTVTFALPAENPIPFPYRQAKHGKLVGYQILVKWSNFNRDLGQYTYLFKKAYPRCMLVRIIEAGPLCHIHYGMSVGSVIACISDTNKNIYGEPIHWHSNPSQWNKNGLMNEADRETPFIILEEDMQCFGVLESDLHPN